MPLFTFNKLIFSKEDSSNIYLEKEVYSSLLYDQINESPLLSGSMTVVIPALNEEGNLVELLSRFQTVFDQLGRVFPVLIVDDGSTDQSPEILAQLAEQYPFLSVIRHPQRRGVAAVWQTALDHVRTDWIFWGQADLESDPLTDLPTLLGAYQPGRVAIAGWRQQRGDGKIKASQLANRACRWAFGLQIHDMNWIKLVRREALVGLPIELITHRFLLAVLAGLGHSVVEVATPWHPRFSGTSKFGKKRLATSARDFLRVWIWFYLARPWTQAIERLANNSAEFKDRFLATVVSTDYS